MPAYCVVSRLDGNNWVVLDRVSGTQYLDRTALPGKNQYRVQAYNSDGAAGQASTTTAITVPNVERPSTTNATSLSAPMGVRAVAGDGSVTLLWSAVPAAGGYVIERAWQAEGPFKTVGTTGATVYRDTASVGAVAYYRVRAFSGNDNGSASEVVTAALVPMPQPQASSPTAFVVSSGGPAAPAQTPGTLVLGTSQTTASAGATVNVFASGQASASFSSVELQTLQQGTWVAIGQLSAIVSGNNWTANGSVPTSGLSEGSHQVRAVAVTATGTIVATTATSTLNVVQSAPVVTGVSSSISGDTVHVSWTPVAGATYNVYRTIGSGNSFALAATNLTTSTFVDSSLAGTQVTGYVVTMTDVYGNESAFSQAQWITTPSAWNLMPPDLSILTPNAAERPDQAIVDLVAQVSSHIGIASIDFAFAPIGTSAWTSIPNVLPIKPSAPSVPNGPWAAAAGLIAWATSFSTTGLAAGKYSFRVTATDKSGRTAQQFDSFAVGAVGARGPPTPGFTLDVFADSTGVHLTWTGAAGDLFQVRRSFGTSAISQSLATTSTSQYTDSAVLPGSQYQYEIVRLSPSLAYTSVQTATAVSSFNATGQATSSDGNLAVGIAPATSDKLEVDIAPDTAPPPAGANMTTLGQVYDINATSLASGAPVHRLDQPATLTFAIPAGVSEAQAQTLSVFHWDQTSATWVREPTTVDWAHRQLIATVSHFSVFTIGTSCVDILNDLCYTDAAVAVISLKEPTGLDTLKVSDSGSGIQFSSALGSGTLTTARSSMTSLIINAGTSNVEINGNLDSLGGTLEIDASSIKVDSGLTVSATGAINFNAVWQSNGHSLLGITSTLLGVNAGIDLADTTLTGASIDLEAFAGTLSTTVSGAGQTLPGSGTLNVASTYGFSSSGSITVDGVTGTCPYTGTTNTSFTGITVCTGTPADGASVRTNLTENGSGTGINHAGLQLIYSATINIHGASPITATSGNVKIASATDVVATANAAGGADLGTWTSGVSYTKGDIVTDPSDSKRYAALNNVPTDTTPPHSDSTNWKDAKSTDSSVTAAQVSATAKSQLSGTSSITAASGDASITSNLKTNITSTADSTGSGSGAGIAVAVLTTDSESFVDSTAGTPISAKNLTLSADTNNVAPTTAKESPGATKGNDEDANSSDRANGKSKTGDGTQGLAGALAVTVLVETTKAYIAPADQSSLHNINVGSGTEKVHAGATNSTSAIADAGNVKFSPDAPTFTGASSAGGFLTGGTTYYYRVSAIFAPPASTTVSGGGQDVSLGSLNVASASGFGTTGRFTGTGITGACSYTGTTATSFTGITGCTGTPADLAPISLVDESVPGAEATYAVPTGTSTNQITLNWGTIPNATGYNIYRGTSSGGELLLANVGAVGSYADTTNTTPAGAMPTADGSSGVAIAIAVNVASITTDAYLAGNASLTAGGGVTVEATSPSSSSFTAHSTSGAGGSSVGVAGSVAVNVVTSSTTAEVKTPTPVAVSNDLALTSTSNLANNATADAKQASDGSASGIGASVAVNVVNDTTSAGLADGSELDGAHNLTATANGTDSMTTKADGGASAGSGSLALSAQVAIAISNLTTSASVGTGAALTLTGTLTAHATQAASSTTKASGSTKGGNAGIGLSLGLEVANHIVQSQLNRNLSGAGGAVSFTADGSSANDTEASASSAGAPEKKDAGDTSTDSSNKDVNGKADDNLKLGNDNSTAASGKDSGSTNTPKAKSGENGGTTVTVAAAAAIAIVTVKALATLADGISVTTSGSLSLNSSEDADSKVIAKGSATKAQTANIGAAAAINLVKVTNQASTGTNTLVHSNGLSLSSAMNSTGGQDSKDSLDTESTAGGGGGKVGIAGSLALTIADIETSADLRPNGLVGDTLGGGDLTLSATSSVESKTKAIANDKDAATVGIGASASINSVDDVTTASIDGGAAVSGANKVALTATDTDTMTTYAEAGADSPAGSTLGLTADAAISLPTVTTSATIGGDGSQTLTATGDISLTATQTAKATTTAKGDAVGGTVVIGLALALAIPKDDVIASVSRTISGTSVSLSALGSSHSDTEADASAKGAKGKGDDTSGKDVNKKSDDQLSNANGERSDNTGKTANTTDTQGAKAQTSDKDGGSNTVAVAGALGLNITETTSQASLADTANVTATSGKVTLRSEAGTLSSAKGSGKADNAGTVGIGVGVAVNKVDITNLATTGNATVHSYGLDVQSLMRDTGDAHVQRFHAGDWSSIDTGDSFPEEPSDGDFFQLTKGTAATTQVDGGSQSLGGGTLKVKSTAGFGSTGMLTVTGIDDNCKYTSTDSTHFYGITACTGTPDDKVTVTSATGTTVNGGSQSLAGGTLNVASTADFPTSGKFTIDQIDDTCSYSGKTAGSFTGITGCSGTPDNSAPITLVSKAPGVYKWNNGGSSWDFQTSGPFAHGTTFPGSPSDGDFFILDQHEVSAEAESGAGGDKDKVSIAGALGLNIVSNHTSAIVGGGAHVDAGTGEITLKAQSNEADSAKADSDAKAGKVGIGASAAINVLNAYFVRAAIENGASVSGGANLEISADSHHDVATEDKAGTEGGVAISPAVSLAIVSDTVQAHLGSGADITLTGD